jgi:nucleoside-diphosphate-sugar epimerase
MRDGWSVHAVVRPSSNLKRLHGAGSALCVHVHDGTTRELARIVKAAAPHTIFHLAALPSAEHQPEELDELLQSNVIFPTQLAEAAVEQGCLRFINTGSHWQHYEGAQYSPVSLYAACKEAFEKLLRYYVEARGMAAITLALFDTYGCDDDRPKLFNLLKEAARSGRPLAMTPGEQAIDLVYVDDVVDAYCVAAAMLNDARNGQHETFAVRSGDPVKLRELVRLFSEVSGCAVPVHWGARSYRLREIMTPWKDGRDLPGWKPKISLSDGLRRLVA